MWRMLGKKGDNQHTINNDLFDCNKVVEQRGGLMSEQHPGPPRPRARRADAGRRPAPMAGGRAFHVHPGSAQSCRPQPSTACVAARTRSLIFPT